MLQEEGGANKDTAQKIARANLKVGQVAKTWSFGTRNQQQKMPYALCVKVMKAVIMPTLTCFGRSRVWNREHIFQLQRVVNHAVRRCLGTRKLWMHNNHVNGAMLCEFAQWEPFEFTMARQSLFWLGHVARMGVNAYRNRHCSDGGKDIMFDNTPICDNSSGCNTSWRKYRLRSWIGLGLRRIERSGNG